MRIIAAALLYFLIVFGVGFVLGPLRVFTLEPRFGETAAVLCEAPFLLIAIVVAARLVPRIVRLKTNMSAFAGMGIGALLLQQIADLAVGSLLRGITPGEQIARLARPAGLVYVALVVIFAATPALMNVLLRRRSQGEAQRLGHLP